MFGIRRNLKGGKTFGFWQVSTCKTRSKLGKEIEHIDGTKYSLVLKNCYLHNVVSRAKVVHGGAHRERCGWIVCDSYEIVPKIDKNEGLYVSYDPKKSPHFLCDEENIDKTQHNLITTQNYSIYVCD